ncbi:MAG TPA: hypothetical protein VGG64_27760 [Pirellulales bacterium]|jgi:hypothetical protein
MPPAPRSLILSPLGILLVALSLSVGWGIRGNYGHETGAMFPGAVAAIAVCLLSGRADWRERVLYFAFFGAFGWAFGGSISYMQVIGYTHSGHLPSQLYGFAGLYVIGFLWGSLGGAGTALPAVLDRRRLTEMFVPMLVVLGAMGLADFIIPIVNDKMQVEGAMKRQDSPLYWLDSDYLQAVVVVLSMLLFDLCQRRFGRFWELGLLGAIGAALGAGVQWLLNSAGLGDTLWNLLVRPQGDASLFPVEKLVTNWPNFLPVVSAHLGWAVGLAVGVAIYFARWGRFAYGSRLFLYMGVGWLAGFILLPVMFAVRMTPPRGDDWAGILGVVVGALVWCARERLTAVIVATLVSGAIGGLGFSGIALLKLAMVAPGNPNLVRNPETVAYWQHWQHANWHSFLEQSYGFVNGIGIAVALGLLATRIAPCDNSAPRRRWTEVTALLFVVPWLLYENTVKNVADWTTEHSGFRSVPQLMQSPFFDSIELSATGWFNLFFAIATFGFVLLIVVHLWRPLAIVPTSWLGRGQMLYFLIIWSFVLANFAKSLTGFTDQRLMTEGTVLVNAVICTIMILIMPRETQAEAGLIEVNLRGLLWGSVAFVLLAAGAGPALETLAVRELYGDAQAGHASPNYRFGPDANWKARPILKGTSHR